MLKPDSCKGCPLYYVSNSFSKPEGNGTTGVIIVGEALGSGEAVDGLPFRPKSQAGSKLEEAFRLLGVNRNQFLMWNLVACQPPGNELAYRPYERGAIEACRTRHFDRVVKPFKSPGMKKVILALGALPYKYLTGREGYRQGLSDSRGYAYSSPYGVVVPSYHPSYIRRGSNHLTPVLVSDLKRAMDIANGSFTNYPSNASYKKPRYIEYPSLDDAWSYYYRCEEQGRRIISYDIETPKVSDTPEEEREDWRDVLASDIKQIQFSYKKGSAIAMDYNSKFMPVIKKMLALPNDKANHNTWAFDNPILKAAGHTINGKIHDTQWMVKHYNPSLEKNLQQAASYVGFPFTWKHYFAEKLAWYGCADVDAVQYIMADLPPLMREIGVWDGYVRHLLNFHPIMLKASDRGTPVNESKREVLRVDLTKRVEKIEEEVQEYVPNHIKNLGPRRKDKVTGKVEFGFKSGKLYKGIVTPKAIRDAIGVYKEELVKWKAEGVPVVKAYTWLYNKLGVELRTFQEEDEQGDTVVVKRWCQVKRFNPRSSKQVLNYIKWKVRDSVGTEDEDAWYVPTTIKAITKEQKETTGKDAIKELAEATGDDFLGVITKFRSYKKLLSNDLPNWKPNPRTGAVHTTWNYGPPQGQLASRKPNIQNCSKHTEAGQEFRGIIEAPPGYTFVEMDYKSFHVAIMGYRANDPNYIRFSQLDPHSIFASYLDGIPKELACIPFTWSDADILEACKEIKERFPVERQKIAKPAVLGNQLGLGPYKLWKQNKKYITSKSMAEDLQGRLRLISEKAYLHKDEVRETAHRQTYLKNEFGYIQYFFNVFNFVWNKSERYWMKKHGDDSEKCIAFDVQSPAFGRIKEAIIECERLEYNRLFRFINTIHDSCIWMPKTKHVDTMIELVRPIMSAPCPILVNEATGKEGLRVGVDVSVGRNWKKWDSTTNREGMREIKV